MSASGEIVESAVRWLVANRWLLLAIALFVFLGVQWLLRDKTPPDDSDVGEPPPAGGVA